MPVASGPPPLPHFVQERSPPPDVEPAPCAPAALPLGLRATLHDTTGIGGEIGGIGIETDAIDGIGGVGGIDDTGTGSGVATGTRENAIDITETSGGAGLLTTPYNTSHTRDPDLRGSRSPTPVSLPFLHPFIHPITPAPALPLLSHHVPVSHPLPYTRNTDLPASMFPFPSPYPLPPLINSPDPSLSLDRGHHHILHTSPAPVLAPTPIPPSAPLPSHPLPTPPTRPTPSHHHRLSSSPYPYSIPHSTATLSSHSHPSHPPGPGPGSGSASGQGPSPNQQSPGHTGRQGSRSPRVVGHARGSSLGRVKGVGGGGVEGGHATTGTGAGTSVAVAAVVDWGDDGFGVAGGAEGEGESGRGKGRGRERNKGRERDFEKERERKREWEREQQMDQEMGPTLSLRPLVDNTHAPVVDMDVSMSGTRNPDLDRSESGQEVLVDLDTATGRVAPQVGAEGPGGNGTPPATVSVHALTAVSSISHGGGSNDATASGGDLGGREPPLTGLAHWEMQRAVWKQGHVPYDPHASAGMDYKRHDFLADVELSHFDAIYNSLVQAQRKFTRPMPLDFVSAVLVHGWRKEGLFASVSGNESESDVDASAEKRRAAGGATG
ncbi:hypothetical protein HDU93_007341 [Gonapodya sp. JEL0774]|nr:hypothetical protein HDU93_007341 [Gonapodya sp. JEL0774]